MMTTQQQNSLKQYKGEKYSQASLGFISAAFFIVITSVFPLYLTRWGYFYLTREKTDFFILFTILAAAGVIIALFITTDRFKLINHYIANEPKRPLAIYEWALAAFLLLTLASAVASPWQDFVWGGFAVSGLHGRFEGFWAFLAYGLTFFIIARFYRPRRLHFLIFSGSAILLSLYGILQYLGLDLLESIGYFRMGVDFDFLTGDWRTTLGNINIVSAYCSLVIVIFAVLFAGENSRWGILYFAASVLSFWLLSICGGDAGRVGVLGAMLLLLPYWFSGRLLFGRIVIVMSGWCAVFAVNQWCFAFMAKQPRSITPNLFIALGAGLLIAGLYIVLRVQKWPGRVLKIASVAFLALAVLGGLAFVEIAGSRFASQPDNIVWQAREMLHGRLGDEFGTGRGWVWKNGLSVIRHNPVLGTGPDTFFFALGGQQALSLREAIKNPQDFLVLDGLHLESLAILDEYFDKAHNTFLQIAVCMGLPALFAYLIFLGALFIPAAKKAFKRPVLLAFSAGSLSYLIQCFFQVDTPIDRPLLYIALGVMAVELWLDRIETKAETIL
jgi:hypothetical protein